MPSISSPGRRLAQTGAPGDAAAARAPAAGSQQATVPPPAPTPFPGGGLVLAPPNITIVRTAQQLQQAIAQRALDIEIRAHLDLTPLFESRPPLPDTPVERLFRTALIDPLALLEVDFEARSIRGNCSDPDPAAALALDASSNQGAPLLPLKPFQCLLLVPDTFLSIERARFWLDNLYLRLQPKPLRVLQTLQRDPTFVTVGRTGENYLDADYSQDIGWPHTNAVLMTDITFQGDPVQGLRAVYSAGMGGETTVFIRDCIFSDWAGRASPVAVTRYSSAVLTDTVFRSMRQTAEIVDVSFGGLVRFEDVFFADANLPDAPIVSTSLNDYQHELSAGLDDHGVYYALDDDNYDVTAALLPPGDGGVFGADHIIEAAIMSDCIFQDFEDNDTMPHPGCPPESVAARAAVAARLADGNATLEVVDGAYYEPEDEDVGGSGGAFVFGEVKPLVGTAADGPEPLFDYEYDTPGAEREFVEEEPAHELFDYSEYTVAPGAVFGGYDIEYDAAVAYGPGQAFGYYEGAPLVGPGGGGQPFDDDYGAAGGGADQGGDQGGYDDQYYYQFDGEYDNGLPSPAERLPGVTEPNKWTSAVEKAMPVRPAAPADWPAFTLPPPRPAAAAPSAALVQPLSTQDPREAVEGAVDGVPNQSSDDRLASVGWIILFVAVVIAVTLGVFAWLVRRRAAAERAEKKMGRQAVAGGMMTGGAVGGAVLTAREAQDRKAAALLRQLDLYREDDPFLEKYELLGRSRTSRGSDTLVQQARGQEDGRSYAIKFFLNRERFATEAALHAAFRPFLRGTLAPGLAAAAAAAADAAPGTAPPPGDFLPAVDAVVDGEGTTLVDPRGRPLPPCIVMDKGLSLQDWIDTTTPDLFTALAMLSSVSKRLAALHDAGYVHCDLKPSNIMLMTSDKRWTVVGFSRAACAGAEVPLHLTLAYAAPESVRAFANGEETMRCTPEMDAWALGVIAFELLTGAPAFRIVTDGQSKVLAQLKGDSQLPWEGSRSSKHLQRLGMLQAPVMRLLERIPAHRASARQFHTACNKAFADAAVVDA
eukprot:jgi/Ulvmu1/2118/UM127_0003.1